MKKTLINFYLVLCTVLFGCGSAKTPFTYEMQQKNHYSQAKLKKIQFYTSEKITFSRTILQGESITKDGQLTQVDNTFTEVVKIPKGTPCVIDSMTDQNKFIMNFGSFTIIDNSTIEYDRLNVKNLFLVFGVPKNENCYSLMCKNWQDDVGEITVNDKNFYTTNNTAFLMIRHKTLERLTITEKTIKGKRVN